MNWLIVLQNVSFFGIASWLIKSVISHALTRNLDEAKNRFTIGATSHMANTAFDKHVQFCEEYARGVNDALMTMLKKGPHKDMLQSSIALGDIRSKWILWVGPEMVAKLGKFESDLSKIGANFHMLEA